MRFATTLIWTARVATIQNHCGIKVDEDLGLHVQPWRHMAQSRQIARRTVSDYSEVTGSNAKRRQYRPRKSGQAYLLTSTVLFLTVSGNSSIYNGKLMVQLLGQRSGGRSKIVAQWSPAPRARHAARTAASGVSHSPPKPSSLQAGLLFEREGLRTTPYPCGYKTSVILSLASIVRVHNWIQTVLSDERSALCCNKRIPDTRIVQISWHAIKVVARSRG